MKITITEQMRYDEQLRLAKQTLKNVDTAKQFRSWFVSNFRSLGINEKSAMDLIRVVVKSGLAHRVSDETKKAVNIFVKEEIEKESLYIKNKNA